MDEMNKEIKEECKCGEECTCGEECNCTPENKCHAGCTCGEECHCGDDCDCEDDCCCNHECDCHEEDMIEQLQNKIKMLEEQNLREKAEMINFRRRKEEETARMLKFCNEDLVKDILPTIDNFERAIKMDDDNLEDEVSKYLSGVKMIYCNLINTLEKYGVKAIDGFNKVFDPTYHQAVIMEKRDDMEPGVVIEVLQKGYLLKDRVIRPAMVKVSE